MIHHTHRSLLIGDLHAFWAAHASVSPYRSKWLASRYESVDRRQCSDWRMIHESNSNGEKKRGRQLGWGMHGLHDCIKHDERTQRRRGRGGQRTTDVEPEPEPEEKEKAAFPVPGDR